MKSTKFLSIILILIVTSCHQQSVRDTKSSKEECFFAIFDEDCLNNSNPEYNTIRIRKFDIKSNTISLLRLENSKDKVMGTLKIINQNELNPLLGDAKISYCTYKIPFNKNEWEQLENSIEIQHFNKEESIYLISTGYSIELYKDKKYRSYCINLSDSLNISMNPFISSLDSVLFLAHKRTLR